jgi:hypothetical protein
LIEETNYPFISLSKTPADADSLINIRFVNLSPNSNPFNIKIQGATIDETNGLAYKGITSFKAYTAKVANPNYKFEIRDGTSNILLITYTFNITPTNRFKNVALVIRGLQGGISPNVLAVSEINYFQ